MKIQITSFKQLYIPKPCHQDWDEMTVAEQGRHCGNCQKMVYDFSDKTVDDFNILYKTTKGEICGRFEYDQINQDLVYAATIKRKPLLDGLRKIGSFLITLITLKIASIREGYAQSETKDSIKTESVPYDSDYQRMIGGAQIQGRVQDKKKNENGIDGATILLYDGKGKRVTSTTSANGYFYFTIPPAVELNQTFSIVAEKPKSKTRTRITRYTRDKKKITQKDFASVILSMGVHKRWRRDLLGRKPKVKLMGRFRID